MCNVPFMVLFLVIGELFCNKYLFYVSNKFKQIEDKYLVIVFNVMGLSKKLFKVYPIAQFVASYSFRLFTIRI